MSSGRGWDDYCRLFILGGKGNTEDEFRDVFGKYGMVKDVWILKDRHSNQDKGMCKCVLSTERQNRITTRRYICCYCTH